MSNLGEESKSELHCSSILPGQVRGDPVRVQMQPNSGATMNARVLIADDHRMFGEAVRTMLEKESGIIVVGVAENGAQTLKMVASLLPDILVLDIEMPDMSGLDITNQLAAQGNNV